MYDRTDCSGRHNYFYKKKKQAQYKISILHYCSKGDRCLLSTARSTGGGTQRGLDLERDPLMHITEEHSKENPKLHEACP